MDNMTEDETGERVPIISNNRLRYTFRQFSTAATHSGYPNNQEYLATMGVLSFWNGAYNSNGNSNLRYCNEGEIQSKTTYGTNANGAYYKFGDGTLICAKRVTGTIKIDEEWYSLGLTSGASKFSLGNWAMNFISKPNVTVMFDGGNPQWVAAFPDDPTTSFCGSIESASASTRTAGAYYQVIGIGRWK